MAIFKNLVNRSSPQEQETDTAQTARPPQPKPPRFVIDAPLIHNNAEGRTNGVRIKALPSQDNSECRLMVDRPLLQGLSWYFSSRGATRGSALATTLFAADEDIESILLHDSTVTLTRLNKAERDWKSLAQKAAGAIREHLASGQPPISQEIRDLIPGDEALRLKVQSVIDEEINPGVASHGGVISLLKVEGNAVTVNMGGGCQGCSAAALTLKGGIERAFRDRVPELGALLDATDHAAGINPYFN